MKKYTLLFATLLLLSACGNTASTDKMSNHSNDMKNQELTGEVKEQASQTAMVGSPAPDLAFINQEGEKVTLSDLKGKKVYINLWATWCPPCKAEMPELEKIYQEYKDDENMVFVGLASPMDAEFENSVPVDGKKSDIDKIAKELGVTYPIVYDTADTSVMNYDIRSFPSHILINSDGTLAQFFSGAMTADMLKPMLASLT